MHSTLITQPLKPSGTFDNVKTKDLTPLLGSEILDVNLKDWLTAPDSDTKLRDLAIYSNYHPPPSPSVRSTLTHICS